MVVRSDCFTNSRALLYFVWQNDVTHLGMRGIKKQQEYQMNDFVITEQHPVQRKLSQENKGNGPESTTTKSGDPYQMFIDY